MNNNDPTLDFERHYALIRSPQPVTPHGLTRQMAETLMDVLDPGRMESFIVKLAQANDVDSLKRFSNTNLIDDVMDRTNRSCAVMFAPAHMLIDNSGNEEFARHWMERCRATKALASNYYQKESRLSLNNPIHEQHRLGVATIAKIFELDATFHLPERDGPVIESPFEVVMSREGSTSLAQQSRELAFILRTCHPDRMPLLESMDKNGVQETSPLSDKVWGGKGLRFRHLLDGLSEAYSPDNAEVLATMRSSIDRMMEEKFLSIEPARNSGGITGYQWKALDIWAPEGYGAKIWSSRMVPDTSCIELLVSKTGAELDARMKQLVRMGADINEPTMTMYQGDLKLRLMELAVSKAKPEVVAWLLAHGADPDLPMAQVDGAPIRSAAQMAIDMTTDIQSPSLGPQIEQVATLMRAHMAKKSALGIIAELDEIPGQGFQPH